MSDSISAVKFPEILDDLISSHYLSRSKIAAALEISSPALSHYLNGDALPRLDLLIKIAAFFEVSLDYLVLGRTPHSPMDRDMANIASLLATMSLRNQDREESHLRIYTRIAETLRQEIRSAAVNTYKEFQEVGANIILEREVLELEQHARAADVICTELWDDILISDDNNTVDLGAFFHTAVNNLNRKDMDFRYRMIFPRASSHEMHRIVHTYRHMLRQHCAESALNRFLVSFTEHPLITGCAMYQIVGSELEAHQPILFEHLRRLTDDEGWVGLVTSTATLPQTNIIMDINHLTNARKAFDELWRTRTRLKKE